MLIQGWTALYVWLYFFREEAPYNRLYKHRLDRIGCFMCQSSDMALIHMIETDFADLWKGWCAPRRLVQGTGSDRDVD
ncbi:MAG: phosphoadenosine phosphosulfate reductase family protein [Methanoregula sp.]